jgi:uncharacterized protein YceK
MKKFLLIIVALAFISGCASLEKSEFFKHNTQYADGDHLLFSWFGYKHASVNDAKKSQAENWWGEPVVIGEQGRTSK